MGSLTSKPKAPVPVLAPAPVVYASPLLSSSAVVTQTPISGSSVVGSAAVIPVASDADKSEIRAQNLLKRNRGVLGTIVSGFRGVLNTKNDLIPQRKTLLGE